MKKTTALKYTTLTLASCVIINIAARGLTIGQDYVWSHAVATAEAMAISAGKAVGLEQPHSPKIDLSPDQLCERAALRAGINPVINCALMHGESGGNPLAISNMGAIGLMQVMPFNAKLCRLESKDLLDPEKNVACGTFLFKRELERFNYDVVKAIQSYNGGPDCVGVCRESVAHSFKVLKLAVRSIR